MDNSYIFLYLENIPYIQVKTCRRVWNDRTISYSKMDFHSLTSTPCYSRSNSATDYRAMVVNLLRRKKVTFFKNQWCHAKNWRKWWLGRVKARSIVFFLSFRVILSSSCLIWGLLLLLLLFFIIIFFYSGINQKGLLLTVCSREVVWMSIGNNYKSLFGMQEYCWKLSITINIICQNKY